MYLLYHTFFEARNPRPHFLLQVTLTHTRPCASPSPGRAQPAGARGATVVSRQVARATVVSRRVARGVGKQAKCARSARRTTGGDRENECSSRAAKASARSAGRATGRTGVRVARGHKRACEGQEGQPGRRGEQVFEWRAGTSERAKRRKDNQGDGEKKCSSRARAAASRSGEGQRARGA